MPSPKVPSLLGGSQKKTAARAEPPRPAEPIRWYQVLEDKAVPTRGGSVLLRAGKEISSANFDMALVRRAGVKIQEVPTPAWFVAAQADSERRHAELTAQGVELEDHPPAYEPPPPAGAAEPPPPRG